MTKKSFVAVLLTFVLCFCSMSLTAFAAETTPEITDNKEIIIETAEDLRWVSDYSNEKVGALENVPITFSGYTIVIENDIPDVGVWTPIVNFQGNMTGKLKEDGTTPVISGVYVTANSNAGLCANSSVGKFSNLTIQDSSFVTTDRGSDKGNYAGAFAASGFTSSFENCHVIDTIVTGGRFVGGITGYCYGNIKNCSVTGTAEGETVISAALNVNGILNRSGDNAGGIVGLMGEGRMTISECFVDNITVQGSRQVGGIAGLANYGTTITENKVSNTTLYATYSSDSVLFETTASVGGVVGQLNPNSSSNPITITDNTVENLSVSRSNGTLNYCGWLIGDVLRGDHYTVSGNTYEGETTLPEIYGVN